MIIDVTNFTFLQKAVQENHTTQRRHMKTTNRLIKAQESTDGGTMADIATEAAAEATARSQHIQQETQKLTKKIEKQHLLPSLNNGRHISSSGDITQDPEADVQNVRKRNVHQLDISERLPWLKGLGSDIQPRIDEDDDERAQRDRDHERLTSPDSGVMDHLSEAAESLDGNASSSINSITPSSHLVTNSHRHLEEDNSVLTLPPPNFEDAYHFDAPSLLQHGELSLLGDYPILPPPKDYPSLEQQTGNMAGDAYTLHEAKLNSRPAKAKAKYS